MTLSAYIKGKNLVVDIIDTGPGIPPEDRKLIFERFYQVRQRTDDKDPGTGLGLAISLHLAQMHGGRVFLKSSNSSSGSCFTVEIPLLLAKDSQLS